MSSTKIVILILILCILSNAQMSKKCCLTYDKSNQICLTCPEATYYSGNNCLPDVDNCADFSDCGVCSKCADGFNLVDSQIAGKKIKKCQELSSYLPIDLDKKTEQGPSYDAYIISDDYMKNIHKQLKPGKTLSAYHKSSPNGLYLIKIQYEVIQLETQTSKYYRTTMQIDLNKYQFKEIDFAEIEKTDLGNIKTEKTDIGVAKKEKAPIDTSGGIGEASINGEYLEKTLDLREQNNLKIVQAADVIVRGSNLIYKKVVAVKIKTDGNGKQFVEITYLANDDINYVFLIDASSKRVVSVNGQLVSKSTSQPVKKAPTPQPVQQTKPAVTPPPVTSTVSVSSTKTVQTVANKDIPSNPSVVAAPPSKPIEPTPSKQLPKATEPAPTSAPSIKTPQPTNKQTAPIVPPVVASSPPQTTQTTPSAPANTPPVVASPVVPDPQTGIWPKQPTSAYTKQDNIEVLKDLKFLVAKDLLNKKLSGYQDILPKNCYSKTDTSSKTFLMLFNKPDGIQTQTLVKIISASYAAELIYERKVGLVQKPTTTTQSRVYTTKDVAQIAKSSYFICAAIRVSKAPNGYNSDNLISVAVNEDDPNTIYYRSVYNVDGKLYEVESLTKKKLRIGQMISEKDITPPGAVINLIKPKVEVKQTENANPTAPQPVQSTPPATAPVPTSTSNPSATTASIPTPSPPAPPVNPASSPPTQDTKPTPPSSSNLKTEPISSQKPLPPNKEATQVEKPSSVVKPPPPTPKSYEIPPVVCEFPKTTPKFDQLLRFSPNTELPQSVLTQIGGFAQMMENTARTDVNFLRIESFVECTSSKIIKDSLILAVFNKGSGFSSQFKIYYETPKKVIYQVFVTIDRIKSKIYIINFNPISFGVQ